MDDKMFPYIQEKNEKTCLKWPFKGPILNSTIFKICNYINKIENCTDNKDIKMRHTWKLVLPAFVPMNITVKSNLCYLCFPKGYDISMHNLVKSNEFGEIH